MKFKVLQDHLRDIVWAKIEKGELTGLRLAQMTGFKQAHISNFLNRKRGLSLEGMDKILAAQHLSVLDLLDPAEVNQRATIVPPSTDEFENIALIDLAAAARPEIAARDIKEFLKFRKTFLARLRSATEGDRRDWLRFVAIRIESRDAQGMHPRFAAGATLLVDRHYNVLEPYRKGEPNLYVVLKNGTCAVRYAEVAGNRLILRPHDPAASIDAVPIPQGKDTSDLIMGRVCFVGMEA